MSEMILRDNLITLAQTYASAKGLALSTVSKQIHGKQDFLTRYAAGEVSVRLDTYFSMIDTLRGNWPEGTALPRLQGLPGDDDLVTLLRLLERYPAEVAAPILVEKTGLGKNVSAA